MGCKKWKATASGVYNQNRVDISRLTRIIGLRCLHAFAGIIRATQ